MMLLAPQSITKLDIHLLSAVRYCLFSTYAVALYIWSPLHLQHKDTHQPIMTRQE